MAIRVALADDSLLVREGLAQVLSRSGFDVVASCDDMPSLLAAVEVHHPNVVLTDIRMPPSKTDEGIQIARILAEEKPSVGVIVLSQFNDPTYAIALLEGGSSGRGYLLKERLHDEAQVRRAVETIAEGGSSVDPSVVERLVAASSARHESTLGELTPREAVVLGEIAQGKSNGAIAASLVLTKRAVEKHINSIFLKLNLSDAGDVSKRVKATLLFLAESGDGARRE